MTKAWLSILLAGACTPPTDPPRPDAPPAERQHVMTITPNLDLLFVIDVSGSMVDKQNALRRAFPKLVERLVTDGRPNLHLGVVSTDLGTSAAGAATPPPGPSIGAVGAGGCTSFGKGGRLTVNGAAVQGTFVVDKRDGTKNYTGTLESVFSQMASLGATGCGFEQQLGAMRRALENTIDNAGFVRASANLGVVVLSDEDDCSAADPALYDPSSNEPLQSFRCFRHGVTCAEDTSTLGVKTQCQPRGGLLHDVAPFRDFLFGLKQNEARRVMLGAIIAAPSQISVETRTVGGQPQIALAPACTYPTQTGQTSADPAVRLHALATSLGGRSTVASICSDDLTAQATQLGDALRGLVEDTCLPAALPIGADCIVRDHRDSDASYEATLLPCDRTTGDCFRIVEDATCAGSQQRVAITRAAAATPDTWSTLRCAP